MKKVVAILAVTAFAIMNVSAQWSVGAHARATGNNVQVAKGLEMILPQFRTLPGYEVGVSATYDLNDNWQLVGEANYTQRGFRVHESTSVDVLGLDLPLGLQVDTRVHNISVPIMAQYRLGGPRVGATLGLGPELTYGLDGRLRTRGRSLIDFNLTNTPVDLDAINYQRFDVGAVAALGLTYQTTFGQLYADARFRHGFNDLIQIPIVDTNVKSYSMGLGIGVRVDI